MRATLFILLVVGSWTWAAEQQSAEIRNLETLSGTTGEPEAVARRVNEFLAQ